MEWYLAGFWFIVSRYLVSSAALTQACAGLGRRRTVASAHMLWKPELRSMKYPDAG